MQTHRRRRQKKRLNHASCPCPPLDMKLGQTCFHHAGRALAELEDKLQSNYACPEPWGAPLSDALRHHQESSVVRRTSAPFPRDILLVRHLPIVIEDAIEARVTSGTIVELGTEASGNFRRKWALQRQTSSPDARERHSMHSGHGVQNRHRLPVRSCVKDLMRTPATDIVISACC